MDIETHEAIEQKRSIHRIQSSCEYLTLMRYSNDQWSQTSLPTLELFLSKLDRQHLNFDNFIQLLIQSAYLIFTCRYYEYNLKIDVRDVRVHCAPDNSFSILMYYRLGDQKCNYLQVLIHIYKYLFSKYEMYLEHENKTMQSTHEDIIKRVIKKFIIQQQHLVNHLNCFSVNRDQEFFLCLEETCLFRNYSLLLKVKNRSILNYLKPNIGAFKEAKERDKELTNKYINEKKKIKGDIEELKQKEKAISDNVVNFFKTISSDKYELIFQPDQNQKLKFIFRRKFAPQKSFRQRLATVAPQVPPFEQMNDLNQPKIQLSSLSSFQYYIEYLSEQNSICIRYVFNYINANTETSDFLMFLSNVLSFDFSNINIEVVEAKQSDRMENEANEQKKKFIAFKGSSTFSSKEPMLEKMLVLMDLTMISGCVSEPELNPVKAMCLKTQNHNRFVDVSRKVNHYAKIYLNCAKNIYD